MPIVKLNGSVVCPKNHTYAVEFEIRVDVVGTIEYESLTPYTCPVCRMDEMSRQR